jgi:tetratricopeptide (TPR) repeat protein
VKPKIFLPLAAFLITFLCNGCAHRPQTLQAPNGQIGSTFTTPKLDILNDQVRANPDNAQAYSNRGYTLALLGLKQQAREDLKKAVTLKNTAPMHNGAGWSYFNLGDYTDALREWKLAAEMSKRRAHYDYYSLALGYWGAGDWRACLENYQLAVEREPKFGEAKSLQERTAEWTPLERRAIFEIYARWSKAWRP